MAGYASVRVPAEPAVTALERWAAEVEAQVQEERAEQATSGLDRASFRREVERPARRA